MKIAFIGGGNMAAALIGGLIKRGVAPSDIRAIDPNEDARKRSEQQFGVGTSASGLGERYVSLSCSPPERSKCTPTYS